MFPLELYIVLFLLFYLYKAVLVKTFALICLYSLDLVILEVSGNMICLAFGIF